MLQKDNNKILKLVSLTSKIIQHANSFLFIGINEQVCMTGNEFNKNSTIFNIFKQLL